MVEIVRIRAGFPAAATVEEIGAKAANLARMAELGLPVPPAFVLPVGLCAAIVAGDRRATLDMNDALETGIKFLETETGRRFGDRRNPLLVSVRSGAARSMPGMLDTVLNVGCTSAATRGLIRQSGSARFAWDCRRRFLEGYAESVLGLDPALFSARLQSLIVQEEAASDQDLDSEALERLASMYVAFLSDLDAHVPDEATEQLAAAAHAVFVSWTGKRASAYRRLENLQHLAGTAVTVQAMVFGNRGLTSGSGVAFSRDPSSGARHSVTEVLIDAQGEDVVSGRRTPEPLGASALAAYAGQLDSFLARLEHEYRDIQDVEFTIEDGALWILQTRAAKRSPRAALRIAIDLVQEGMIAPEEALRRLASLDLDSLAITRFTERREPAARGLGVSGGVAVGRAAFNSEAAKRLSSCGDSVILVRPDTSTADVEGFSVSAGIVTAIGGRTAHAALVARQMGKPCVVGCPSLIVDESLRRAVLGEVPIAEGDWISIDGDEGAVFAGRLHVVSEQPIVELQELAKWRMSMSNSSPAASRDGLRALA